VHDQTTDPDGKPCTFATSRMIDLLVDKLNEKAADRDSGPSYASYGQEISFLRQTGKSTSKPRKR
jgi:hypothetical protein